MAVLEYDIRAETGEGWSRTFQWIENGLPMPLGGATAEFLASAEVDGPSMLRLTSASGIALGDGAVTLSITRSQLRTLRAKLTLMQEPFAWGFQSLVVTFADLSTKVFLSGKIVIRKTVGG